MRAEGFRLLKQRANARSHASNGQFSRFALFVSLSLAVRACVCVCCISPTHTLTPSLLPLYSLLSPSGDLCGLASGLAFAAWITTCRHSSQHRPEAPLALCGSIGTLVVLLPAAILALHRGHGLLWLLDVTPRFVFLVLLDCAAIAAYNVGTMIASRHLPSAELGLYLTLDVVLGPLLVWLVHGEMPSSAVLRGGGLLVSALLAHEAIALISPAPLVMPVSPKCKTSADDLAGMGLDESAQPLKQWRHPEEDA